MQKIHDIGRMAYLFVAGLVACSDPGGNLETLEAPKTARQPLTGPGTVIADGERPEVVDLGGCTATLIHRYFLITAAHCGPVGPRMPAGQYAHFHLGSGEVTVNIDRAVQFHSVASSLMNSFYNPAFQWAADTSLLRLNPLDTNLPLVAQVTPAIVAMGSPYNGETCTTYGWGQHSNNGLDDPCDQYDGHKRRREWTFPPTSDPAGNGACGGDSGGPSFFGNAPGGDIFSTTLTSTGLGNLPLLSEEILEQIRLMMPDPATGKVENWVWGADRAGFDLPGSPLNVSSTAACQAACITNNQCRAWSYAPSDHNCWLKDSVQRWTSNDYTYTGTRPVIEDGYKRVGATILNVQLNTARNCRYVCGDPSVCGSFTYDSTTKVCTLFSDAPTPVLQAPGETKQSGLPPIQDRMHREGTDYQLLNNSSAADCRHRCAGDYFCQSYTFNSSDATCHMKDGPGGIISSTTETSGIRRRPSLPGVRLTGTVIGNAAYTATPPSGVEYRTVDLCAADCENNMNCVAYTAKHHVPGDLLRCTLYSTVTGEVPVVDGDDPEVGLARQITSGYTADAFY